MAIRAQETSRISVIKDQKNINILALAKQRKDQQSKAELDTNKKGRLEILGISIAARSGPLPPLLSGQSNWY